MILCKKRITKALIRLRGCTGWYAPVLLATPQRQVFSRRGPFDSEDEISQFLYNHQMIIASWLCNFGCCKISLRTRLNIPFFQFMLADYDDVAIVELLKYGFHIGFVGKLNKKQGPIKNHRGVIEYPKEVQKYLEKEKLYDAILVLLTRFYSQWPFVFHL